MGAGLVGAERRLGFCNATKTGVLALLRVRQAAFRSC